MIVGQTLVRMWREEKTRRGGEKHGEGGQHPGGGARGSPFSHHSVSGREAEPWGAAEPEPPAVAEPSGT